MEVLEEETTSMMNESVRTSSKIVDKFRLTKTPGGYVPTSREHSINSHPMSREDDLPIDELNHTPKLGNNKYLLEQNLPLYSKGKAESLGTVLKNMKDSN